MTARRIGDSLQRPCIPNCLGKNFFRKTFRLICLSLQFVYVLLSFVCSKTRLDTHVGGLSKTIEFVNYSIWFTFVNEKTKLFSLFCQCAMASLKNAKNLLRREFWELLRWQMFEVQKAESFPSYPSVVVSLKVAIPIWKAATFECKKLPPFFHKKGMKSTRKKVETFIIILGWRNIVSHVDLWQACFTYKRIFLRNIGTVLGKKVGFLFL